jgi:hypothetical protein
LYFSFPAYATATGPTRNGCVGGVGYGCVGGPGIGAGEVGKGSGGVQAAHCRPASTLDHTNPVKLGVCCRGNSRQGRCRQGRRESREDGNCCGRKRSHGSPGPAKSGSHPRSGSSRGPVCCSGRSSGCSGGCSNSGRGSGGRGRKRTCWRCIIGCRGTQHFTTQPNTKMSITMVIENTMVITYNFEVAYRTN